MGVPLAGFRVATNQNDILHRLFTTGEYRLGAVQPSLAPSMDIQVASNFERLLYYQVDQNPARVRDVMAAFRRDGAVRIPGFHADGLRASRAPDAEIPGLIARVHREFGYVVDPHTACGFQDLATDRPSVVLATASPAKFPDTLRAAIGLEPTHPSLEALKSRPIVRHRLPADAVAIRDYVRAHAVR
jgi:threonine synthase